MVLTASVMTPVDKKGRQAPIDYNIAKAIYNGLLEYCCDLCDACNTRNTYDTYDTFNT